MTNYFYGSEDLYGGFEFVGEEKEYAQPHRWKIRLIKPKRFLSIEDMCDIKISVPLESDLLTFPSRLEAENVLNEYLNEFAQARLPQPDVAIVAFDRIGREL